MAPAMMPVLLEEPLLLPPSVTVPCVLDAELVAAAFVEEDGFPVTVDAGDALLRQVLSSDMLTVRTLDEPPERPWPSVMVKMTDVPALILVFQL